MLDTHGRKFVEPIIQKTAGMLVKWGLTANTITFLAFLVGVMSGIFVYFGYTAAALISLWLSGFLDAVDGSMARMTNTSPWGTILDITFDRLVEVGVIIGLAWRFPDSAFALLLLSVAIIISMTVFLTVGAVSENKGMKSFYYQAGLAERTEGFVLFSLMIIFTNHLAYISYVFFGMILITAGQRLLEARKMLSG